MLEWALLEVVSMLRWSQCWGGVNVRVLSLLKWY